MVLLEWASNCTKGTRSSYKSHIMHVIKWLELGQQAAAPGWTEAERYFEERCHFQIRHLYFFTIRLCFWFAFYSSYDDVTRAYKARAAFSDSTRTILSLQGAADLLLAYGAKPGFFAKQRRSKQGTIALPRANFVTFPLRFVTFPLRSRCVPRR